MQPFRIIAGFGGRKKPSVDLLYWHINCPSSGCTGYSKRIQISQRYRWSNPWHGFAIITCTRCNYTRIQQPRVSNQGSSAHDFLQVCSPQMVYRQHNWKKCQRLAGLRGLRGSCTSMSILKYLNTDHEYRQPTASVKPTDGLIIPAYVLSRSLIDAIITQYSLCGNSFAKNKYWDH